MSAITLSLPTASASPVAGPALALVTVVPGAGPSISNEEKGASATSLGLQLAAINQNARREFRIPRDVEGVVVTKVASDSPAAALGIEPGDAIMSVENRCRRPRKRPTS